MLNIWSVAKIQLYVVTHKKILLGNTHRMSYKTSNRNNYVMKQLCTLISLHQGYTYIYIRIYYELKNNLSVSKGS